MQAQRQELFDRLPSLGWRVANHEEEHLWFNGILDVNNMSQPRYVRDQHNVLRISVGRGGNDER
jgi:hypothetical protein